MGKWLSLFQLCSSFIIKYGVFKWSMTASDTACDAGSLITVISKQDTHFNSTLTKVILGFSMIKSWLRYSQRPFFFFLIWGCGWRSEDFRKHLCLIQRQTPPCHCVHILRRGSGLQSGVGGGEWASCLERACLSQRLPTGIRGMWISEGPPRWYPVAVVVSRLSPPHPSSMNTTHCPPLHTLPLCSQPPHPTPHPCPLFLPPALALPALVLPECGAALSAV